MYDEIVELLHAKPYGHYAIARCPFHEDRKPSFMVFEDGRFLCLSESCGITGDHKYLLRKLQTGISFHNPLEEKPVRLPRVEVTETFVHSANRTLTLRPQRAEYLRVRGVAEMIGPAQLGWYDGWITMPLRSASGELTGMVLRADAYTQERTGLRFFQPKGQEPQPYIPDWGSFLKADSIMVVFGMFDALTLALMGYPAMTSAGGARSFDARWLDGYGRKVYLIPDKGEEQVVADLVSDLGWRGNVIYLHYPDGCKDPNDYLRAGLRDELREELDGKVDKGMRRLRWQRGPVVPVR